MYDGDQSKYDSPSIGGEDIEFEEEGPLADAKNILGGAGDVAIPFLKKFWPLIILGIIVLAVLFFLYYFFIGSMAQVDVSVVDTEGDIIPGGFAEITDSGGNIVGTVSNGSGKISMRIGDSYTADASAQSYKTKAGVSFSPTGSSGFWEIKLEKRMNVELQGELPGSFATGETKTIPVTIINNESSEQTIRLVVEDDLEGVVSSIQLVRRITILLQ